MTLWKMQVSLLATKAKNPHKNTFTVNVAGDDDITKVCQEIVEYIHHRGIGEISAEKLVRGTVEVLEITKIAVIHVSTLNGGFLAVSGMTPEQVLERKYNP